MWPKVDGCSSDARGTQAVAGGPANESKIGEDSGCLRRKFFNCLDCKWSNLYNSGTYFVNPEPVFFR